MNEGFNEKSKTARAVIRNRILKGNLLPYSCNVCSNNGSWEGKKLSLHLDHINGINDDHRLSNLRFLCPNCHAQTKSYGGKNAKKNNFHKKSLKELKSKIFRLYGKNRNISEILKILGFDNSSGNYFTINKILEENSGRRPPKKVLEKLIWSKPLTRIGLDFGVTDNAVKKWCKFYNLKRPPQGYWLRK